MTPVGVKVNGKKVEGPSPVVLERISVNGKEGYAPRMTRAPKPGEKMTLDLSEGKSIQLQMPKDAKPIRQP